MVTHVRVTQHVDHLVDFIVILQVSTFKHGIGIFDI